VSRLSCAAPSVGHRANQALRNQYVEFFFVFFVFFVALVFLERHALTRLPLPEQLTPDLVIRIPLQ
jgi:hypothetical protein